VHGGYQDVHLLKRSHNRCPGQRDEEGLLIHKDWVQTRWDLCRSIIVKDFFVDHQSTFLLGEISSRGDDGKILVQQRATLVTERRYGDESLTLFVPLRLSPFLLASENNSYQVLSTISSWFFFVFVLFFVWLRQGTARNGCFVNHRLSLLRRLVYLYDRLLERV